MPVVSDATKVVSFPFRPIGFKGRKGHEITAQEIKDWYQKEKPNFIQSQSFLTIGGAAGAVIGVVLGLIGFKKDERMWKWLGGFLALVGVIATGVGKLAGINLDAVEAVNKTKSKSEKSKDGSEKENFLEELGKTTKDLNMSSGFCKHADYETDPNSFGGKYIKSVNSLVEKYGKQQITKWLEEVIVDEKLQSETFVKLKREEQENICAAILCSSLIGDGNVVEKLLGYINDNNLPESVRENCFLGLTGREVFVQKDHVITSKLMSQLNSEDSFVRIKTATSLGKIKDKKAVEALNNLLTDPVVEVTEEAAEALGKIKDPEAIRALGRFYNFGGGKRYVQGIAMTALEKDKDYATQCLIETLNRYYNNEISEYPHNESFILDKLDKDKAANYHTNILKRYCAGEINEVPNQAVSGLTDTLEEEKIIRLLKGIISESKDGRVRELLRKITYNLLRRGEDVTDRILKAIGYEIKTLLSDP